MTWKVNEGNGVCLGGCWGVVGVSESDMRGGGDDPTDTPRFCFRITNKLSTQPSRRQRSKKTVPV